MKSPSNYPGRKSIMSGTSQRSWRKLGWPIDCRHETPRHRAPTGSLMLEIPKAIQRRSHARGFVR